MHFEMLIEDQSGKKALDILVPKIIGSGNTFEVHGFKGIGHLPKKLRPNMDSSKKQLLSVLPPILRAKAKAYGSLGVATVVIVCDLDNRNFDTFLAELQQCAKQAHAEHITRFCLAIEEGEAWLLGDIPAIMKAYPKAKQTVLRAYENDSICGTWEKLADAVYPGGSRKLKAKSANPGAQKYEWAERIAPYMNVWNNKSASFCFFRDTIVEICDEAM